MSQVVSGGFDVAIRRLGRVCRDDIAVRTIDRTFTFSELATAMEQVAAGFRTLGLVSGDRMAIWMDNSAEWLIAYLAGLRCGAILVPVNILASDNEMAEIIDETDVGLVVTSAALATRATTAVPGRTVVVVGLHADAGGSSDVVSWDSLLSAEADDVGPGPSATDVASLYYSSATTGRSKAAIHTHSNLLLSATSQIIDVGIGSGDVQLVTASLSWAAGLHALTMPTLLAGGSIVLIPLGGMSGAKVAAAISDYRPTTVMLIPTLLKRILADAQAAAAIAASGVRRIITGAEPVPLWLLQDVRAAFPGVELMQGYGMSEFPLIAALLSAENAEERTGWAGRVTSLTELAIRTDEGIFPHGEGEILVRSPMTTVGYWNRPEESARSFRDGWLHTGDLGELTSDGYLRVTGRSKDLVISGGLNVSPAEVEFALQNVLPGREIAVLGIPDAEFGEKLVAVIGGQADFSPTDVQRATESLLPRYKVPRRFFSYGDELPKGPTGKLLKRDLVPWIMKAAGQEA